MFEWLLIIAVMSGPGGGVDMEVVSMGVSPEAQEMCEQQAEEINETARHAGAFCVVRKVL